MATELTTYTTVQRVHNMEATTSLAGTNPKNYVALLSSGSQEAIMDLPLKNMVKVYLENPENS